MFAVPWMLCGFYSMRYEWLRLFFSTESTEIVRGQRYCQLLETETYSKSCRQLHRQQVHRILRHVIHFRMVTSKISFKNHPKQKFFFTDKPIWFNMTFQSNIVSFLSVILELSFKRCSRGIPYFFFRKHDWHDPTF